MSEAVGRPPGASAGGLFNYSMDPGFFKALTSHPQRPFTPEQLLAYSFGHPVQFQPGEKFEYSNTNAILLGLVVEKVGGRPLAEYIERNVLEPAGMNHTFLPRGTEFPAPHAHGHTDQTASGRTEDAADWNRSWAWAAGGMVFDQSEPSTLFGEAITRVVTPQYIHTLPAQPAGR
ncbi:serine hydrolase domain-containing protein [Streptomyces atratus]|uniref:serine hydrolase domain-containing protein n=1 Tax=Streptomyces atratus TaxID=1893 RepID=UPI0037A531DD